MAKGFTGAQFYWNGSHSQVIENLGFQNKAFYRDMGELIYQYSFPYMPYVSGDLALNFHIQATNKKANLVHQVRYANVQYTKPLGIPRYTVIHDKATSQWYKFAYNAHKAEILKEVDLIRQKYRTFNYGK